MSNEVSIIENKKNQTSDLILNSEKMNNIFNMANMMAKGAITVPKHLQGHPSDCIAVIMQAIQWNMNPFAVAQKTHWVNGNLGYEAQLVNAVVVSSGAIDGKFKYEYKGDNNDMSCRVGAIIKGENEITWNEFLSIKNVAIKNSPLWKTNPKQQISYLQVKNWARLYAPECILGVYSDDELGSIKQTSILNKESQQEIKSETQEAYKIEKPKHSVTALFNKLKEKNLSDELMIEFAQKFNIDSNKVNTFQDVVENFEVYFSKFESENMSETKYRDFV